jgi:heme exporter protein A
MPSAEQPLPPPPASRGFAGTRLACRRGERLVFARLDFSLAPGGALILVGPNGSGKSSLLRLMAGLSRPARGILTWDGVAIDDDREAHCARLHFIGHADALKPLLTVEETLRFWAGMRRREPPDSARIDAALAQFGLERGATLPCRYLSAGQRRRLALARLVASPAALWLLDEPTTGLDTEAAGQLHAAIDAHRRAGGSIVLSTHAPLEIADAAFLSLADHRPTRADLSLEFAA